MTVTKTLTEAGLQQLERELSASVTPPPSESQNTPVEVEMRNVSNLVFLLSRYTRGRECMQQHKIAKSSPPFGILYRGAEPNLEELQTLKVILQTKYDQLKPKEQPDGRLRRLKQEVLNILLRLFQLGNQGHWVLGEEEDIRIREYTYNPVLEYHGSGVANPDWWEGKLARLIEKFKQAENNVLPFTTAPAETIDALREQLAQQRKSFQRPRAISVGDWVQNSAPPSKRSLTMIESEDTGIAQPGSSAKRRKLAEPQKRVDKLIPVVAIGSPRTSSRAQAMHKTEAPPSRSAIRRQPRERRRRVPVGGQTMRRGDLGGDEASVTQESCKVQTSRSGRVLRPPDRYGFPNPDALRRIR